MAGVAVLVVAAAFWYLVWPLSAKKDALEKQVETLHAQNVRDRAFEAERTVYLKRIAESESQLRLLSRIVPDQPNADAFVKMIREAEAGSGVHVRTFVAQPLVTQDQYVEMPFKMRVDGTYYALADFFNRLAHGERIVNVSSLTMGQPAGGGMGPYQVRPAETVGANFLATTYFNRPPSAPASAKPAKR
ncbi:MAG: type 4a pilus biogenesis protein PilO [Steroidobacteraceae bacterium]